MKPVTGLHGLDPIVEKLHPGVVGAQLGRARFLVVQAAGLISLCHCAPAEAHERFPALSSLFALLIRVRNRLMHVPDDFRNDPEREGFRYACRVHHYPRGGGILDADEQPLGAP